jgi:hypothetical protein
MPVIRVERMPSLAVGRMIDKPEESASIDHTRGPRILMLMNAPARCPVADRNVPAAACKYATNSTTMRRTPIMDVNYSLECAYDKTTRSYSASAVGTLTAASSIAWLSLT